MALPADVLPKVLALVPADLRLTSSLRVASRSAKERVEARWWTAQVQRVKAFVDRHANVFADDPEIDEENADVTIEEQQEAFARNILLWVKPLLKNQPWRLEGPAADVTGEVTLQAAYINLRRALANLSERSNYVLRSICQQARCIEGHHRHTVQITVSQADRRQMEDPIPPTFVNLESSEIRSEDAMSGSFAHTAMTRDGNRKAQLTAICRQLGISDEVAQELLTTMEREQLMAPDPFEGRSEIAESETSSHVMDSTFVSAMGRGIHGDMVQELQSEEHVAPAPVARFEMRWAQQLENLSQSSSIRPAAGVTQAEPMAPARPLEIVQEQAQECPEYRKGSQGSQERPFVSRNWPPVMVHPPEPPSCAVMEPSSSSSDKPFNGPSTLENRRSPGIEAKERSPCVSSGAAPMVVAGRWTRFIINMMLLGFLVHSAGNTRHGQSSILKGVKGIIVSPETEQLHVGLWSCEKRNRSSPPQQNSKSLQRSDRETDWLSWNAKRIAVATVQPQKKASRRLVKMCVSGLLAAMGSQIRAWCERQPRPPSSGSPKEATTAAGETALHLA
ncbi:unnamed protein product, partial [Durusdinium trenchii]